MNHDEMRQAVDELEPVKRAALGRAVDGQVADALERLRARYAERVPLASAGGAELDVWGRLLGMERDGADDEAYRVALSEAMRPAGVSA